MSERLSAEQLRDVQELPATSAGNVLMRATMRNALLAHISVLEAELQEAREQRDMLQRSLETRAGRELEMLEEVQKMVLDDFRSRLVAAVRADLDDDYSERVATFIEQFNAGEL